MNAPTLADSSAALLQSYLDNLLAEVAPQALTRSVPSAPSVPAVAACDEDWRTQPFQALLFRVSGVRFAVPLLRLAGVLPWTGKPARLPETPDWFLGLLEQRGRHVRVIDTARLLLPSQNIDVAGNPRHVILLDRDDWGLTCEALNDVLLVQPDGVKWRAQTSRRPWLAGMLREQLCALVDIDELAAMLAAPAS